MNAKSEIATKAKGRRGRRARRPQLEAETPIVAIAVARQVVEEATRWLGEPLPSRYAAGLAHRARRVFAHSGPYRRRMASAGEAGRDWVYALMRHWLAARLQEERPGAYARLPRGFALGEELAGGRKPERGARNGEGGRIVEGGEWSDRAGVQNPECRSQ